MPGMVSPRVMACGNVPGWLLGVGVCGPCGACGRLGHLLAYVWPCAHRQVHGYV